MMDLGSLVVKGATPDGREVIGYYSRCEDTHYISAHEHILTDPECGHYDNHLIPYEVLPESVERLPLPEPEEVPENE